MAYPLHRPSDAANPVPASPSLPDLERDVLDYWEKDDTFRASVEARPAGEDGSNEFVFYDGPPFANGLPHYGHLLTGYVKDVVPRYRTMRGQRVERRFGWDTHGLPAELEAMSQLGIKTKDEIVELGIDKFNQACRSSVLKYTDEWRTYVTRQARWVDFDNDYKTLNPTFMESVIWAFKSLFDKGLIYEGFRVLPYCWNDQTPAEQPRAAHGRRRVPAAAGPGGDGRLPGEHRPGRRRRAPRGRPPADLDHHALDPALQPAGHGGPGRRLRDRRVVLHRHPAAVRDRRGARGRLCAGTGRRRP